GDRQWAVSDRRRRAERGLCVFRSPVPGQQLEHIAGGRGATGVVHADRGLPGHARLGAGELDRVRAGGRVARVARPERVRRALVAPDLEREVAARRRRTPVVPSPTGEPEQARPRRAGASAGVAGYVEELVAWAELEVPIAVGVAPGAAP